MSISIIFTKRSKHELLEDSSSFQNELTQFAALFEGMDSQVYLIGGVGLAIQHGKIYRDHKDFDIALFLDDLPKLTNGLAKHGYQLVKRNFFTHLTGNFDVQLVSPISLDKINDCDKRRLRLRFLKHGPKFRFINRRTEMIDIFLWRRKDDGVYAYAYDTFIPWSDVLPAQQIKSSSTLVVPCIRNWNYFSPKSTIQGLDFKKAKISNLKTSIRMF